MPKEKRKNVHLYAYGLLGLVLVIVTGGFLFVKLDSQLPNNAILHDTVSSQNYQSTFFTAKEISYPYKAIVYDPENNLQNASLGVSTDIDKLDFSQLPLNAPTTKTIDIDNTKGGKVKIRVEVTGNGSRFITVDPRKTYLLEAEKTNISVIFHNVDSAGYYEGNVNVYVIRPKEGVPSLFLRAV